jgi:hypothetical protein
MLCIPLLCQGLAVLLTELLFGGATIGKCVYGIQCFKK